MCADILRPGRALNVPADGAYNIPLSAGRELDALVAEKVMGWTNLYYRETADSYRGCPPDYPSIVHAVPFYSTKISDAWLIVEKLCPTASRVEAWFKIYTSSGQWFVNFHHGTEDVHAETAPLAICRASLAAVDPVGPDNDFVLRTYATDPRTALVVAAWGTHGTPERVAEVASIFPVLHCFGRNRNGSPKHPLYLPSDAPLSIYREASVVP